MDVMHAEPPKPIDPFAIRTIAEIVADGGLELPEALVYPLLYQGHVTVLTATDKSSGSSLAAAVAAATSKGSRFLDQKCTRGSVLWVSYKQATPWSVAKLDRSRIDPDAVYVLDALDTPHPYVQVNAAARRCEPTLIVIDAPPAMTNHGHSGPPSPEDSAGWSHTMQNLVGLAQATDAAVLMLHHQSPQEKLYREDYEIGAQPDVIVEMGEEAMGRCRTLKVHGLFGFSEVVIQRNGDQYVRLAGDCPEEIEETV